MGKNKKIYIIIVILFSLFFSFVFQICFCVFLSNVFHIMKRTKWNKIVLLTTAWTKLLRLGFYLIRNTTLFFVWQILFWFQFLEQQTSISYEKPSTPQSLNFWFFSSLKTTKSEVWQNSTMSCENGCFEFTRSICCALRHSIYLLWKETFHNFIIPIQPPFCLFIYELWS